jgi:hypothetical protein
MSRVSFSPLHITLDSPALDTSLPPFPKHLLLQLVGFVDAAHATDVLMHHSITGLVFCLASGANTYKSKLQTTISTSSTDEAKLIVLVHAGKITKYLHFVLLEFGIPQHTPTAIYEDYMAAIAMINGRKLTP